MNHCIECERAGVAWKFCEATRIVPCSACGGDGGGYEGGNERWIRCAACDGRRQLRIQALGAAISRKDWHAVTEAYNAIRDAFDRPEIYDQ